MERVAEDQLVAEGFDVPRLERPHRPLGRQRHECRRANLAVREVERARASTGLGAAGPDRERHGPDPTDSPKPHAVLEPAHGPSDHSSSNERPVISAGWSMPSSASNVGATSASTPPSRSANPSRVTTSGTGLSEWAVFGDPSGSSM